jgi:hypothetical protein
MMAVERATHFVLVDYLRDRYAAYAGERAVEEIVIRNEVQLESELLLASKGRPRAVDLITPDGDRLSIGQSGDLGCLWFTQRSGEPPYLWAVRDTLLGDTGGDTGAADAGDLVLSIGGAWIPIAYEFWLARKTVWSVVVEYYRTQRLSDSVRWEEIDER